MFGRSDDSLFWTILAVVLLLGYLLVAPAACVDREGALRQLAHEGFTNVEITGYEWFACHSDDLYSTGFNGAKNGQAVHGVVCKGVTSTIRYY